MVVIELSHARGRFEVNDMLTVLDRPIYMVLNKRVVFCFILSLVRGVDVADRSLLHVAEKRNRIQSMQFPLDAALFENTSSCFFHRLRMLRPVLSPACCVYAL